MSESTNKPKAQLPLEGLRNITLEYEGAVLQLTHESSILVLNELNKSGLDMDQLKIGSNVNKFSHHMDAVVREYVKAKQAPKPPIAKPVEESGPQKEAPTKTKSRGGKNNRRRNNRGR